MQEALVFTADPVAQRNDVDHIVHGGLPHAGEDQQSGAGDHHEQQQQRSQAHVDVTQQFHTTVQAAHYGNHRRGGNTDDDRDLHVDGVGRVEQEMHATGGLFGAQAQ